MSTNLETYLIFVILVLVGLLIAVLIAWDKSDKKHQRVIDNIIEKVKEQNKLLKAAGDHIRTREQKLGQYLQKMQSEQRGELGASEIAAMREHKGGR